MAAPNPQAASNRSFVIALVMIEIVVAVLHLNTLRRAHIEGDEVVFTFIAERVRGDITAYTMQGELTGEAARRFVREVWEPQTNRQFPDVDRASALLSAPDPSGTRTRAFDTDLYDLPLFIRPPLFVYTLAAVRSVFGVNAGLLLPVCCHLVTILLTAVLGRMCADDAIGLTAAGLMAVESISWVMAERIWIDGMMQMLVTAAVLASLWSARRGGTWRFALAGAVLGLAGLTKLVAGLALFAVLLIWLREPRRPARKELLAYILPPAIGIGAWLVITKISLGVFFPIGLPTAWMIQTYPWIARMVARSPLVYVVGVLVVSPILLYAIPGLVRVRRASWLLTPLVWAAAFWVGLTAMGMAGLGFQMRHVSSGIPALCLIAAAGIQAFPWPWRVPVIPLAAYSLVVGIESALIASVDPLPQQLAVYLAELFGWNLFNLPWVW